MDLLATYTVVKTALLSLGEQSFREQHFQRELLPIAPSIPSLRWAPVLSWKALDEKIGEGGRYVGGVHRLLLSLH